MNAPRTAVVALFLVVVCAIAVVYAKHESRSLFVQLQHLRAQRDSLNVEWGRLELEESTWATHSRVERLARQRLGMHMPRADAVVIVRP